MLVLPVPGGPHRIIEARASRRDHPPDRAFCARKMFLPDDFAKRGRPDAISQRRIRRRRFGLPRWDILIGEQVGHRVRIRCGEEKCTHGLAGDVTQIYLRCI